MVSGILKAVIDRINKYKTIGKNFLRATPHEGHYLLFLHHYKISVNKFCIFETFKIIVILTERNVA